MARFLPNSGDIILDAVLTDEGRRRMAGGAGQKKFSIDYYAFGDDEINYELFDHSQATAYKDLNVLNTPILESITDNATALKHKLKTLAVNKDYLYLPNLVVRTSTETGPNKGLPFAASPNAHKYVVLSTDDLWDTLNPSAGTKYPISTLAGWVDGRTPNVAKDTVIVIDQGIKTGPGGLDWSQALTSELEEDQYVIQIDDRFGSIVDSGGAGKLAQKSYVDDDYIATYLIDTNATGHWKPRPTGQESYSELLGPRGKRFWFSIIASDNLAKSTSYFLEFGTTVASAAPNGDSLYAIDTIVRIDGWKTGMSLDIPIRFVREIPA